MQIYTRWPNNANNQKALDVDRMNDLLIHLIII